MRLLLVGLGLLVVSLLLTVGLLSTVGDEQQLEGAGVLSWFSQATLFVGSGLTVAGAVLRHLEPRDLEPAPQQDHFG